MAVALSAFSILDGAEPTRIGRERVPHLLTDEAWQFVWREVLLEDREGLAQAARGRREDAV